MDGYVNKICEHVASFLNCVYSDVAQLEALVADILVGYCGLKYFISHWLMVRGNVCGRARL